MRRFSFVIAAAFMAALASHAGATNLIVNGDFQSGNTGFTSDYSYNTLNPEPELVEGAYSVVEKAGGVHFAWLDDFYDHTLGTSSGRYFVANASSDTDLAVWQSNSITVSQANTPYRFEAWISKIYQFESNPPQLAFQIGDGTNWTNLGSTASLDEVNPGEWLFTYADGQFAAAGTYYVRLKNANGGDGGNDLGLDDIYFGLRSASPSVGSTPGSESVTTYNVAAVPEPSTWAMALTGLAAGGLMIRRTRQRRGGAAL
ncbi:MAG: PEP-CTERM sorting domain-containing protein [Planctomycetia bacterium]